MGTSIYILSLPAFQWFRANVTSDDPRQDHTCNIASKRQMLSVGGVDPTLNTTAVNGTTEQINSTDPYLFGLKVLDLTELVWTNSFDPAAEAYVAPQLVQDFYNGELKYPERWNDENLKDLFIAPPPPPNNTSNTTVPTPPPTPSPLPKGESHTGAIAGGVVGGIVGLFLAAIAIWFFCFRRPRKQATAASAVQASNEEAAFHEKDSRDVTKVGELPAPSECPKSELEGENSSEGTRLGSDGGPGQPSTTIIYEMPAEHLTNELEGETSSKGIKGGSDAGPEQPAANIV